MSMLVPSQLTVKQIKKIQQLLNKSLLALQDAAELGQADYLLVRHIEQAKDVVHHAIAESDTIYILVTRGMYRTNFQPTK